MHASAAGQDHGQRQVVFEEADIVVIVIVLGITTALFLLVRCFTILNVNANGTPVLRNILGLGEFPPGREGEGEGRCIYGIYVQRNLVLVALICPVCNLVTNE
jgi:hypothetical protein